VYTLNAQGQQELEEFWKTWDFLAQHIAQLKQTNTDNKEN
jgi:PadR family transcriptional regulator PadR